MRDGIKTDPKKVQGIMDPGRPKTSLRSIYSQGCSTESNKDYTWLFYVTREDLLFKTFITKFLTNIPSILFSTRVVGVVNSPPPPLPR